MINKIEKIVAYGGGSWGTALANYACTTICSNVVLYTIQNDVKEEINNKHKNSKYLGDIQLNAKLQATTDITTIRDADLILLVVPSFALTNSLDAICTTGIKDSCSLLVATKGIAADPVELFSECLRKKLPHRFGFISGPNFATEVAKGLPASITISSEDRELREYLGRFFASENMEVSITDDIITQQVAGIVKNIIAIKCGMLAASGAGENARATMIAKGLQEIVAISGALGGKIETILEPAVVGDLVLTCSSPTSRNTKFGEEFYRNNHSKEFLEKYPTLVEGVQAARLIKKLIDLKKVGAPIVAKVAELV